MAAAHSRRRQCPVRLANHEDRAFVFRYRCAGSAVWVSLSYDLSLDAGDYAEPMVVAFGAARAC